MPEIHENIENFSDKDRLKSWDVFEQAIEKKKTFTSPSRISNVAVHAKKQRGHDRFQVRLRSNFA